MLAITTTAGTILLFFFSILNPPYVKYVPPHSAVHIWIFTSFLMKMEDFLILLRAVVSHFMMQVRLRIV